VTVLRWYLPLVRETLDRLPLAFWVASGALEVFVWQKIGRGIWHRHMQRRERCP
jgi:hypothetical protein